MDANAIIRRAVLEVGPGLLEGLLGFPEGVRIVDVRMKAVGFGYAPEGQCAGLEMVLDGPGLPETHPGEQLRHIMAIYSRTEDGRGHFEGLH